MREVLEYYLNDCQQAMIHQNELSFEFGGDYVIAFSFDINDDIDNDALDDEYYSYNTISDFSDIDEFLRRIDEFTSLTIKGHEYLGWREDLTEGRSITNEMFSFIKIITAHQQDAVLDYYTSIDFGDAMCDKYGSYLFNIQIIEELWWDIKFAKHLIENSISTVSVPNFYTVFFRKNKLIKDNKIVPVLSTNTKVRRLGYFKILSLFLNENKKVPATSIDKKFENYCLKYKELLEENQFKKGLINETKTGISAKPYIDTANDLEFLNKINNIYYSGKPFKIYQVLKSEFSDSSNVFELNGFDRIFFLECILRNDYFYFSNLLELLYIEEKTTYSHLVHVFKNQLIARLENYKKENSHEDRKILNGIETVLNRIKKWEKPEVYLEHIIMPRLNWMLDFRIITGINNEFKITEIGLKLFQHLCIWNDINTDKIISSDAFLDRFMVHLYDDCYNNSEVVNPKDENLILKKMYRHIENSFDLFKTLAPNRVTASQAANYTKYQLYFNDSIKVGYQYILGKLSEKEQDKFIFKYQEQYQDGYIQNKK
ncbi:hypothetical protein [Flavobacterium chilense]|uniref:Uncharacterized protein n=1 Tax=Flavobacterium chilense TaxID=946677 RepID=A0A1M6XR24_9FLAO|nr:hypothetical protein [Flavobacterium chilense]SHL08447.1 hypothetical protein SAMN05444484_101248 [Flavobacterium chilense]